MFLKQMILCLIILGMQARGGQFNSFSNSERKIFRNKEELKQHYSLGKYTGYNFIDGVGRPTGAGSQYKNHGRTLDGQDYTIVELADAIIFYPEDANKFKNINKLKEYYDFIATNEKKAYKVELIEGNPTKDLFSYDIHGRTEDGNDYLISINDSDKKITITYNKIAYKAMGMPA